MADRWTVDPLYGCWIWSGRTDAEGYAIDYGKRPPQLAHRSVWIEHRGPIPLDPNTGQALELEHSCRRRDCVRPSHKDPVDRRTNSKLRAWKHRSQIKACPNGHPFKRYCIRTHPEGGYVCRECNRGPD